MAWMLEGKKIKWCGEDGHFLTENEYNQIVSAYEGAIEEREKIDEENVKLRDQIEKTKRTNLELKIQLRNAFSDGDFQMPQGVVGDPGGPSDRKGKSFRKLTEANEPGVSVESSQDRSPEEVAETLRKFNEQGGKIYE